MKRVGKLILGFGRWFGLGRTFTLILLIIIVQMRVIDPAPLQTLRLKTFDIYQTILPRDLIEEPVVIVDIDEKSLSSLGQWPWPRTLVAELVDKISKSGAQALAFDVVFSEPDRLSPDQLADQLPNLDETTRESLRQAPSNDEIFARSIRNSKVVVGQSGIRKTDREPLAADLPETPFSYLGGNPSRFLVKFPNLLTNVDSIERAAAGRGLFTIQPERDGIVRRVPVVLLADGKTKPSLAVELIRVGTDAESILIRSTDIGISDIVVGDKIVPADEEGRFWVNFSPHLPQRFISAYDVLTGKVGAERLDGKLILIGTSAVGLLDLKATPVDPAMPGVEIHAQIIETILSQSYLTRPAFAIGSEVVVALVIGMFIIVCGPIFGALNMLLLGGFFAACLVALSWYLYAQNGILFDFAYPLVSTLMVYFVLVFYNYLKEERGRREVRNAFGQYLSPELVNQLAKDPDSLSLGGITREVTILFSDVRNFTAIAEQFKHDPEGLSRLMNDLLTPLSAAVMNRKGTIDKYMGDAIMAFWNAPLDDHIHPRNACIAALEMQRQLELLNQKLEEQASRTGTPFNRLRAGIGINTGECVVGNMGSEMRFDYTAMGDPVNVASRAEGLTKQFGVPTLIGEKTAGQVSDFALLEADLIRVVGKQDPERLYLLLGDEVLANSEEFRVLRRQHDQLLAAYRSTEWDRAMEYLQACRNGLQCGFDLSHFYSAYQNRIDEFASQGVHDDWDGVYEAQLK